MVLTDKIVAYCVCNNVVPESDEAWLRYGIEKRITAGSHSPDNTGSVFFRPSCGIGLYGKLFSVTKKDQWVSCKNPFGMSVYFHAVGIFVLPWPVPMFGCDHGPYLQWA